MSSPELVFIILAEKLDILLSFFDGALKGQHVGDKVPFISSVSNVSKILKNFQVFVGLGSFDK